MRSLISSLVAATAVAFASSLAAAAPLAVDALPRSEPVPLFKLASRKSLKPAPEYLVGSVGVELFVAELSAMKVGEKARMTLPNGKAYEIVLDRMDRHENGDFSWVGHVEGVLSMPVVVTVGAAGTYGSMHTPDGRFGIIPGDGHDWLFDAALSSGWYDRRAGETDAVYEPPSGPFAKADPVCPDITAMPAQMTTIDVLFVMAPDFVGAHGGPAGASTRINSLISQMNSYYAASRIAVTLRRVGAINVNFTAAKTDSSDSPALDGIRSGSTPFTFVGTLRQLFGADMVAFMRGPSFESGSSVGIRGLAFVGGPGATTLTAAQMFSVSGDHPLFDGTLVAHELGHNMGNLHDVANLSSPTEIGATSYAKGWTICGSGAQAGCPTNGSGEAGTNGFGTIMSYWRPTVPRFASPNYSCTPPGGTPSVCGSPMGNASPADTVRSMNCTRASVAGMRTNFLTGCNFATDTDNDGLPDCVESALGLASNVKNNNIFGSGPSSPTTDAISNLLFAMQQYRDFLGREGDADGLNFYLNTIGTNNLVKPAIVESFFYSPEFQSVGASVTRLYFAFFNRFPDYAGFQFQTNAVRSGGSIPQVANNFALSPEFQSTYGSLDNTQYVQLLYNNVLGRSGSSSEVSYHVNRLNTGATRGEVMAGFSESPEYIDARKNHVFVSMMYVGMLRRAPDPQGFDFYLNLLNQGTPGINQITGFYNSPEYHNRFLP